MEILTGDLRSRASEPRRRDSLETPAQPVRLGGNRHWRAARESLGIAVAAIVTVVGLGLAGGHLPNGLAGLPRASVIPSVARTVTSVASMIPATAAPSPALPRVTAVVTPVVPCSAARATSPDPMLAIAGVGRFEGLTTYTSDLTPGVVETTGGSAELQIAADDVVALVFVDHRCALAWDISMDTGRTYEHQNNPSLDADYAAQNQFPLSFGVRPMKGTLTATFRFATGESRTIWHLTILPYVIPAVALGEPAATSGDGPEVIAAPGCALQLSFRNGAILNLNEECASELPQTAIPYLAARPGATLVFFAPQATFDAANAGVRCGHVEGDPPFLATDDDCTLAGSPTASGLAFTMPANAGTWLIAVSGCLAIDGIRTCGSWYAVVYTTGTEPSTVPTT
jgi:hypothetical protein